MTGAVGYHAGLAAEDSVARIYEADGHRVRDRRWRGAGGEIDLVLESDDGLIFVEVKKSRSFAQALNRLNAHQLARIAATAEEYVCSEPSQRDTQMRIDLAVVDSHGAVEILENITL